MTRILLSIFIAVFTLNTAQALDSETEQYIDQAIEQRWQEFMQSEEFKRRIGQGILEFVEEQTRLQQEAQAQRESRGTQQLMPVSADRDHIRAAGPQFDWAHGSLGYFNMRRKQCTTALLTRM